MTAPAKRSPVRYFVLLLDALRRQGVETAQLLRKAGFEETRFDRRKMPLLPAEIEAFVASARQLTGRTDLGFEMGSLIKMNSHDLLGYGMWSCRNFDEVMWMVSRHFHLMTETFTMTYRRTRSHGEAVYTPVTSFAPETLRFMYEVMATSHGNQVRLTFGQDTPVYDIHLSMPEPSHIARYRALAPARFHFGERGLGGVRVVMGADLLDKALPMADPHVVKEVDERCGILGQRPPPGDPGWGDYVSMMLRDDLGELVTLDDLARRINLSARTVDRHLKKENLTFRDLSQKVRFERACELLADPAATVVQVALGLGFTDPASFSRAFRRVVGVSPGQFQQRLNSATDAGR
ncbi:helix-turn-helix domain-containing protein [Verminephrobacter eiseniae]|uniref:Transcriptional regulator, AraC family n=1 Tax=Verminephrobacter eiseniae (strain EF01-2) TaxID=391735 RepID=A1WIX6_VEREI|nr:AraC family transcriptional regulator [Verminephrobacter eiseniae]ABM57583.1 transcriptional regulator, AraC family [Verminephrobacter eiseniae EF01-2]MCW5283204.1 AraC family transcriptional regulator [Verminephrobacter eiseniae]MCW5303520.1 AraC family transcriptional regulator [Verminephrobacter eiseniae]MCW8179747.1 AraC family transcriptional regulator [Verminephrobacter eiseniae]MCW8188314.1 AraC family transcriptional regulator [Verminephrobacter eiseniae]